MMRRAALTDLMATGWQPTLLGRTGTAVTSGDDTEILAAIRLLGWELWYLPSMTLEHAITTDRLEIPYVLRLFEGFGRIAPVLFEYRVADPDGGITRHSLRLLRRTRAVNLVWSLANLVRLRVRGSGGRPSVPDLAMRAYWKGQVAALIGERALIIRARRNAALCRSMRRRPAAASFGGNVA
jgi:hypothetical protein